MNSTEHTDSTTDDGPDLHWSRDTYNRPILTVGQLRAILDGLDPRDHVILADGDWFVNVDHVGVPVRDGDGYSVTGFECVTLFPGEPYDSRQH